MLIECEDECRMTDKFVHERIWASAISDSDENEKTGKMCVFYDFHFLSTVKHLRHSNASNGNSVEKWGKIRMERMVGRKEYGIWLSREHSTTE